VSPLAVAAAGGALAWTLALAASGRRVRPATARGVLLAATLVALVAPALALAGRGLPVGLLGSAPVAARDAVPAPAPPAGDSVAVQASTAAATTSVPLPTAPSAALARAVAEPAPVAPFPWETGLLLAWAAGALAALVSLAVGAVAASRLARGTVPASDPGVVESGARAAKALGLARLEVLEGPRVASPVTVGLVRARVLLPQCLAATLARDELDAVLLHEGSHVARRDPLAGTLARLARAVHWFDPLAWVATRRLLEAQERVADAAVVERRDVEPTRYVACLARLAERAIGARGALAGIAGRPGSLERRVEALLDPRALPSSRSTPRGRALAAGLASLAAAALLLAHERPARGGDGDAKGGADRYTLVGRVLDASGKPVAGAVVHLVHGPAPQVADGTALLPWRTLPVHPPIEPVGGSLLDTAPEPTGEDGRYVVPGVATPAGGWVVVVHPGFLPRRAAVAATGVEGGKLEAGDLRLERGGSLLARVADAEGKPVAGAWVVVQPSSMPFDRYSPGEIRSARTGADGTALVEGLRDAPYAAAAFTDDTPPVEREVAAARATVVDAEFRLKPGASLRVVVLDRASGAPLPGARVDLDPKAKAEATTIEMGDRPMATKRTEADGSATFRALEEGEYVATAVPPDRAEDGVYSPPPFSVDAAVATGGSVEIRLDPPVPFSLAVVDEETGAPVRSVLVEARAEWKEYDRTGGFPVEVRATLEGPKDAYAIEGLRAGPWRFALLAPDHLPFRTEVVQVKAGAPPPRVAMRPAKGTASGRVVARATGEPVAAARVSSYEWVEDLGEGQRVAATTDADGRFRLAPLLGGGFPLRLEVEAPGFLPLVGGQTADARADGLGDLALVRAARVLGVARDAAGKPVAGTGVLLLAVEQRGLGKDGGRSATTDAEGRFAFDAVPPGDHDLVAPSGRRTRVRVTEGVDAIVDLGGSPPR
jgi:beta-lactamase regulating signal transducer with metallopeptidase domain/protocatechuate 3,4-dioxygenase beta subunit